MRIAYDAKRAFCNNTGLGNYSRTITSGIAAHHPDVDLLLLTPARKDPHRDHCAGLPNVVAIEPQGIWRAFKSLWRTIGGGLRACSPNIFHGLSQELPLMIPSGVKSVVTIHDMMPWRYPANFPLFDRIVYKLKVRHACHVADRIVAVSAQTSQDIGTFLNVKEDKISIVYQSCEAIFRKEISIQQRAEARNRYKLPKRYLICVGTIEKRKNQATLVKAMKKTDGDISLVIVGRKTKYYAEVDAEIKKYGLNDRVLIIDNARFEDFPALYAEADAAVYTSVFEGFGIPILEAMSCGTPVVTSNCSSMPEVGGEAALYADPHNPDDIAEKINRLLHNKTLRDDMISKGKEQALSFHPDKITDDLFNLYSTLYHDHE